MSVRLTPFASAAPARDLRDTVAAFPRKVQRALLEALRAVLPGEAARAQRGAAVDAVGFDPARGIVLAPKALPLVGQAEVTPKTKVAVFAAPPVRSSGAKIQTPLPVVYHPGYKPADGIGKHVMPIDKFRFVARAIETSGVPSQVITPQPIAIADILRVHKRAYVEAIRTGEPRELAESSTFAWSPGLFDSVRLTSGGLYAAARVALENGEFAFAPVSGFHHAGPESGDGFCTFNGLAIVAKKLLAEGRVQRVLIVDNDFHYGNGTAHACADEPRIFTFSLCGQAWDLRPESATNRRVLLRRGSGPRAYLAANREVESIVERFKPDLILFQAGMDPLRSDSLSAGTFNLSHDDLKRRDRWMMKLAREHKIPLVANLAGGYSYDDNKEPSPVVVGHLNTFLAALEVYRGYRTALAVPARAKA